MKKFCLVIALLYVAMSAPVGQAQHLVRKFGYTGTWQFRDRAGNIAMTFKFKDNALCNLKDDFWAHGWGNNVFYVMPTEQDPTRPARRLTGTANIRLTRRVQIHGKYPGTRTTEYRALALDHGTHLQITLFGDSTTWTDPQSHKDMYEDISHSEVRQVTLQKVYDL